MHTIFRVLVTVCLIISCRGSGQNFTSWDIDPDDVGDLTIPEVNYAKDLTEETQDLPLPAVVNGRTVTPHQFPFMVSIQLRDMGGNKNFHFCGGALITSFHVLTAAHCFMQQRTNIPAWNLAKDFTDIHVGVGMHHRLTNDTSHYFAVKYVQFHKDYQGISNSYLNDIAIITLNESINTRKHLRTGIISLPDNENDTAQPRKKTTAIGWGLTRNFIGGLNNTAAAVLQVTDALSVLSLTECGRRANDSMPASKICTDNSVSAVCHGDSGGPLFRRLSTSKYQQVGIASYVLGPCRTAGSANIFTRVSQFLPWIKNVLASKSPLKAKRQCRSSTENGHYCSYCYNEYRWSKRCGGGSRDRYGFL